MQMRQRNQERDLEEIKFATPEEGPDCLKLQRPQLTPRQLLQQVQAEKRFFFYLKFRQEIFWIHVHQERVPKLIIGMV